MCSLDLHCQNLGRAVKMFNGANFNCTCCFDFLASNSIFVIPIMSVFTNSNIEVIVLGAGQDVGRSCIVCRLDDKTVMFDCGIHMGYSDHRKFPDFKQLANYYPSAQSYNEVIDCVIISHFHLDHVGALPYFTEHAHPNTFHNRILMTHPTKAICPILLEDWTRIQQKQHHHSHRHSKHHKGSHHKQLSFSTEDVTNCMAKTTGVSLHEIYEISPGFTAKAFYAGHVLGAAMFLVEYKGLSVLYTGDYNMTPDRHLGCAMAERCRPDLLITESTYATMIRESRRIRERNFFTKVHRCIMDGGKVLIPVFALGRAQELMLLLESYWDRMDLNIPIYFSAGLAQKANDYYKFFVNWCNESVRNNLLEDERNVFDFPHIRPWNNNAMHSQSPCVLLATTGMLHAGTSLRVFKEWCSEKKNLVVLPGYCVENTIGGQVLSGKKLITIDGKAYRIEIQVANLSFSAHADLKGILQLIRQVGPKNVMLVHGEAKKMKSLKRKIECELALQCFTPENGTYLKIEPWQYIPVDVDRKDIYPSTVWLKDEIDGHHHHNKESPDFKLKEKFKQIDQLQGHLIVSKQSIKDKNGNNTNSAPFKLKFVNGKGNGDICDLVNMNMSKHEVLFDLFCCFTPKHIVENKNNIKAALMWIYDTIQRNLCDEYRVEIKEECIEVYRHIPNQSYLEERSERNGNVFGIWKSGMGVDCVTLHVEQRKDTQCKEEKEQKGMMEIESKESAMEVDGDGNSNDNTRLEHEHKHEGALSVRIVYPHHLTETASLVQSLVTVVCDSYC